MKDQMGSAKHADLISSGLLDDLNAVSQTVGYIL
jgi:hypothetical protein